MRGLTRAALASAAFLAAGCGALAPLPRPTSVAERLAVFPTDDLPLSAPVTIRWDDHQIPFIEADADGDAAFALGLVHAHLRLGQMAVVRRIVQGRLSESAGPFTIDLDHAIRTLDFYRGGDAILEGMPAETRAWMDRYVAGVNHYAAGVRPGALPHEFAVLAIDWEPWTARDSIALGRAAGVDLNWEFLIALLSIPDTATRERLARRVLESDAGGLGALAPAMGASGDRPALALFARLAGAAGRSGSNSVVVSGARSASGAALIANDPHLAFVFPNAWLIAGLRSPSYAMVGMMVPGTPVFGFGRTEHVAWGGTNLRARSSQFVDVSALPPDAITSIRHRIAVRLWPDVERVSRLTAYGPILSDLDLLAGAKGTFAVRWTGHDATDETTALLGAMAARDVDGFRAAAAGFAFPPQSFLATDSAGRIAKVIAARVPARDAADGFDVLASPERSDRDWARVWTGADLPALVDPPAGFIASANDRPAPDGDRPFGGAFPQDERIRRLDALLGAMDRPSLDDLAQLQLDVTSPVALALVAALRDDLAALPAAGRGERAARAALLGWDGAYRADAAAPAIFETFVATLAPEVQRALGREGEDATHERFGRLIPFLTEDAALLHPDDRRAALTTALSAAGRAAEAGALWGDLHRLRIGHVLAAAPVLGRRYELETVAVSGGRETVFKTAHPTTDAPHLTMFGAQARHLSDMADPDENRFVLLGGQDGWIGSATFADQAAPFLQGRAIRVPLTPGAVRLAFPVVMALTPKAR